MDVDPLCPLCGLEDEIVSHPLMKCPVARGFWFSHPLALRLNNFATVTKFLSQFLNNADSEAVRLWQTAAYTLWEARNRVLFQGRDFDYADVLRRTAMLDVVASSTTFPTQPVLKTKDTTWSRPTRGVFKINFDGSWTQQADSGLGMVARNHEGLVLAAAASVVERASSALVAEALAFCWSIGLALELGFRRVCLETDCIQLFQMWKKPPDGRNNYLSTILDDCFRFSRSFDLFSIVFVSRDGNTVADFLARNTPSYAGHVWIEEVPPEVVLFVAADILASLPPV